ncbi:MAG: hypothetical protein ACREFB_04170 [Stellaceae bacterium]
MSSQQTQSPAPVRSTGAYKLAAVCLWFVSTVVALIIIGFLISALTEGSTCLLHHPMTPSSCPAPAVNFYIWPAIIILVGGWGAGYKVWRGR